MHDLGNHDDDTISRALTVLLVDDSRMQRRIIASHIAQTGHRVIEADSGEAALAICRSSAPDIIISDWMMPGITGPDLCRQVRDLGQGAYVYFILLTSRTEKADIAQGLGAGADDFLTKPVHGDELRARMMAGQRILRMERALTRQNDMLSNTLSELQNVYSSLRRDLAEARKLQQSLVRDRHRAFGDHSISLFLEPCGEVGGDLVGHFVLGQDRVALYGIDVSGHGITSALVTARVAALLSPVAMAQNIAVEPDRLGGFRPRPPVDVAAALNRSLLSDMTGDTYLTMCYADIDLRSGHVSFVQAGHPPPTILRASGAVEHVGQGGLPIGLLPTAQYKPYEATLLPGDRFLIMSDGFHEAPDGRGGLLGEEGLAVLMHRHRGLAGPKLLARLFRDVLSRTTGSLPDDVSAALLTFGQSA